MTYLLDVNVLIALLDSEHVAHETAHAWFAEAGRRSWATCPITENGFLRIVSAPNYRDTRWSLPDVRALLQDFCEQPGHVFWSEDISVLDDDIFKSHHLTRSAQVTDTYLLALAVKNGGKLATFDRRLSTRAVRGGEHALMQLSDWRP